MDLPHPWTVSSFAVEASENVGTKVEPLVKNRFKAKLLLNEETFYKGHQEGDIILLRAAVAKGERRELYGVATSVQKAGSWQTAFEFENNPFTDTGNARSSYPGRSIVIGSPEEAALRAQEAEADRQRELAEKAAAEQRRNLVAVALSSGRTFSGEQTAVLPRFSSRFASSPSTRRRAR